ncbi:MAG: CSLREA domain-containing protein, partial [Chloroflexales bacterium]|nr:CSLREA domain-containing protein [Chloroflexales bacterium]
LDGNRATQSGGGIYNQANLTLDRATLSANSATADGGGAWNGGALRAVNLTASGNSATNGGGIANEGALSLNNATLAANSASGGGVFNGAIGTASIANTLLGGNSDPAQRAPDCAGQFVSQGVNLVQRTAGCAIATSASDIVGTDPLLGPLADNGGATATHALLVASPAVDAGDRLTCAIEDQRGVGRPVGARCDIGAFEQGLVVNSTADAPDANLRDPVCETAPGNGQCTLRAAVQQANGTPGVDAVEFGIAGPFLLTLTGTSEVAAQGDLDITDDVLLNGRGSDSTIIDGGNNPDIGGVLHIAPGGSATIAALTIRNGNAGANTFGGNIRNEGSVMLINSHISGGTATSGGGISNFGQLTVRTSTIIDNSAGAGGGIYNRNDARINAAGGAMAISDSTLSGNRAVGLLEGGGGINTQGQALLTNVTISGNSASRDGGGMRVQASGQQTLTLNNVTLADNVADADNDGTGDGGGIASLGGIASTKNTILAGNSDRGKEAPDCTLRAGNNPSFLSQGYNLVGNASGCFLAPQPGDQMGSGSSPIDPRLGPLQAKGAISVRPPLTGSPAINAGSPALPGGPGSACSDADQSGRARPEGGACDIGASEAILADVRLVLSALPPSVFVGATLTLTIDVSNAGPSSTGDVQLVVELAPQLVLVSSTASQGSCTPGPMTSCAVGALATNAGARVTLVARAVSGGDLGIGIHVRAAEADSDTANNAGALRTTARYALFLPLAARR